MTTLRNSGAEKNAKVREKSAFLFLKVEVRSLRSEKVQEKSAFQRLRFEKGAEKVERGPSKLAFVSD